MPSRMLNASGSVIFTRIIAANAFEHADLRAGMLRSPADADIAAAGRNRHMSRSIVFQFPAIGSATFAFDFSSAGVGIWLAFDARSSHG